MPFYKWSSTFANGATDNNYTLRAYHIEAIILAPVVVIAMVLFMSSYDPAALHAVFLAVAAMSPVWIPLFLFTTFWVQWMKYIRSMFWFSQEMTLLEIVLPPEVIKSPLAMELFLTSIWNSGGEATFLARIWRGNFRPIWSLEIASNEGRISYYIHTRKALRNAVESRLYGQYPEAKILEVEDYASKVPFNLHEYEIWGCEYTKLAPGPVPIKTYVDYQLDKNTDTPEIQVDPLTNMLEHMASIGKDEYVWLQFIVRARKKDEWNGFYLKADSYKDDAKAVIQRMVLEAAGRSKKILEELHIDDPDKTALKQAASRGAALLSEGERKKVEAIERALSKQIFECGIRAVYLAKKTQFNAGNIGSLALMFNPFRAIDLNGLVPTRGMSIFDFPWQDFHNIRRTIIKKLLMFHYRNRAYFYVPYDQVPVFFTTEELATLWHFPSSVVQPPGLERIAAKRAEAPAGLPTGQ